MLYTTRESLKALQKESMGCFVVDGSVLTPQMASPAWPIPLLQMSR